MEDVVLDEVKKISNKYNKNEKLIEQMLYKTIEVGYNVSDGFKLVEDFYLSKTSPSI